MKESNNELINTTKSIYHNNQYNFNKVLSIEYLLVQIFKFMKEEDVKCLSLCSKKIYQFYCNQIEKLIIMTISEMPNIEVLIDKYNNAKNLKFTRCYNIEDYACISESERLENLVFDFTNIFNISFLESNKNLRLLKIYNCESVWILKLYLN